MPVILLNVDSPKPPKRLIASIKISSIEQWVSQLKVNNYTSGVTPLIFAIRKMNSLLINFWYLYDGLSKFLEYFFSFLNDVVWITLRSCLVQLLILKPAENSLFEIGRVKKSVFNLFIIFMINFLKVGLNFKIWEHKPKSVKFGYSNPKFHILRLADT